MMNFPLEIREALNERYWHMLQAFMEEEPWCLANSDVSTQAHRSWSQPDKFSPVYLSVGTYLLLRVQKLLRRRLRLVKVHTNGQTMGQISNFHKDTAWDNVWTCVLFTNDSWNTNNGGEFTLYNPLENSYKSVSYLPNTAVLFPSNWDHRGAPPLVPEANLRTSLAVTYCASEIQEEFFADHPSLQAFNNYNYN